MELEEEPEEDYDEDDIQSMIDRAMEKYMPNALGRLDD